MNLLLIPVSITAFFLSRKHVVLFPLVMDAILLFLFRYSHYFYFLFPLPLYFIGYATFFKNKEYIPIAIIIFVVLFSFNYGTVSLYRTPSNSLIEFGTHISGTRSSQMAGDKIVREYYSFTFKEPIPYELGESLQEHMSFDRKAVDKILNEKPRYFISTDFLPQIFNEVLPYYNLTNTFEGQPEIRLYTLK